MDNSGSIDYGEFLAATMHLNRIEQEETLFQAFCHFDKDKSGFISVDELQQACKEFSIDEDSIMETMREVDTNHVRQPGCRHRPTPSASLPLLIPLPTLPCLAFSQDGIIDYNEFVAMMRKGNGGVGRKTLSSASLTAGTGNLLRDLLNPQP